MDCHALGCEGWPNVVTGHFAWGFRRPPFLADATQEVPLGRLGFNAPDQPLAGSPKTWEDQHGNIAMIGRKKRKRSEEKVDIWAMFRRPGLHHDHAGLEAPID